MHLLRGLRGLFCLLVVLASAAHADPGYYLITPYSQPGEWSLDTRLWTVTPQGGSTYYWPEVGLRYGVNERWTSELLVSFEGPTLDQQSLNSWNWQNEILLTKGDSPYDLAIHLQAIHSPDDGNLLQWGALWQTELGLMRVNFNLIFEHQFQADAKGTQLKYQWQALYPVAPHVRLGVLGFGELGNWEHWSAHPSHRAGPDLSVGLPFGELHAGYLFGKVYGGRADMFTTSLNVPF